LALRARVPTRQAAASTGDVTSGVRVTAREREVLALLVSGRTYGEIATELVISEKTVSSHVSNLLAKTGTSNRVELAGYAVRSHLTTG
jgi:DNA-binding NarL/FixJ family response regulator